MGESAAESVARLAAEVARLQEAERRARLGGIHARGQLRLLALASGALGDADDEDTAFRSLLAVIAGDFADWCAIDVMRDGRLRRLVSSGDPEALAGRYPGWSAPVRRVMTTGRSELTWDVASEPAAPEDADHHALARALGLESCLVVPIRIQGLSVGAIVCATLPSRRGYRPSDVAAFEEVASRTAATIERLSLYREVEAAGAENAERAARLRRLMTAALAVQPQRQPHQVLEQIAHQALPALGVAYAAVTSGSLEGGMVTATAGDAAPWSDGDGDRLLARAAALEQGDVATLTDPATGSVLALAARLDDRDRGAAGGLAVAGKRSGVFTQDDESILVALARMGSVALDNARLYESVQAGEARLVAIVEAAPVAIFELRKEGIIRRANGAAHQLLGTEGGWESPPTAHPETAALLAQVAADTLAGRPVSTVEVVVRRTDGGPVPVSLSGAVLRGDGGAVDGVLVIAADLTARLRLEEQLVKAQRIEATGQVAGGVAHDFNNLLTVILGHAALLAMTLPADDDRREDVDAISGAAERAAAITSQLLTISRSDQVTTEVFDVRARLERLAATTLRSLVPASMTLELVGPPGEAYLRMSSAQFDQVALNLVVNARDAMRDAGVLTIRLSADGTAVTLSVSDTGAGMDTKTAARCFEPFFSTKGGVRGTGLGLATVQSVVTGAGGAIGVETVPGEGTTFTVRLPQVTAEATADEADRGGGETGFEHILLVEDETGLRRLGVEVLRGAGYVVSSAADGQAALEMVQAGGDPPDLLVTDVVMPRLGGLELARLLGHLRPGLPVLFLTGYDDQDDVLDHADVLIKPFLVTDLVDRVRAALDRLA